MTRQCERRFFWSCCTTARTDTIDQHRVPSEWYIEQHQNPLAPSPSGSAIQWATTLLDPLRQQYSSENWNTASCHFYEQRRLTPSILSNFSLQDMYVFRIKKTLLVNRLAHFSRIICKYNHT